MAADLAADLEEAEAEGATPEDVLGNSAFDPRRFAAAWAVARGVTGPPIASRRSPGRSPNAIALTAVLGVLTIGAGLVLLGGFHGSSFAVATRRVAFPGPIRVLVPDPGRIVGPGWPGPPLVGSGIASSGVLPLALMLFIVGVVGLGLVFLYWSPWYGSRLSRRT
jgi:hypothetical protein